jgi:hypothetical protein
MKAFTVHDVFKISRFTDTFCINPFLYRWETGESCGVLVYSLGCINPCVYRWETGESFGVLGYGFREGYVQFEGTFWPAFSQ